MQTIPVDTNSKMGEQTMFRKMGSTYHGVFLRGTGIIFVNFLLLLMSGFICVNAQDYCSATHKQKSIREIFYPKEKQIPIIPIPGEYNLKGNIADKKIKYEYLVQMIILYNHSKYYQLEQIR